MRLPAPNYTQTPNDLFDKWLPHLKEVELKVLLVIMRKTFGWHKIRDKISLSQLEKLTGSTRTNIGTAIDGLIEKGLVKREVVGEIGRQSTYYELIVQEESNNIYQSQSSTPPSPESAPLPSPKLGLTKESPKETIQKKQQQEHVAVFSCLSNLEIEHYEKVWLCKNYDEQTIEHAIEYASKVPIKTTLVQVIKWACEKKPELPLTKEEAESKNKELALKVHADANIPLGCQFEVLNKCIEICFGGNVAPFVLDYSEIGFREKFKEALIKYRIEPK